jgi:hypothetical protein
MELVEGRSQHCFESGGHALQYAYAAAFVLDRPGASGLGSYPQAARSETRRGNDALLTQGLDKPAACPHSPTPTTTARSPPSTMDHPHITHRNPTTTLQYIHLSGRDLAAKLANGMAQIHAWRIAQLADAVRDPS